MSESRAPANAPRRWPLAAVFAVWYAPLFANFWYNSSIIQRPALYWLIELATWVALPITSLALIFACGWAKPADLGFRARVGKNLSWPWLLAALVAVPVVAFYINPYFIHLANEGKDWFKPSFTGYGLKSGNPWAQLAFTLYLALSAGMVEEPLFRGVLRRLFPEGVKGAAAFVVVSTVLFASIHCEYGSWGLIYSGLWGLFFALAYLALRNLWPLILAHVVVDIVMFGGRLPAELERAWKSLSSG